MKRQMWLQNPETGAIWDLLPQNPYSIEGGCALLKVKGLGYAQSITQEQVEVDYFISEISSANKPVSGVLYFNGDKHLKNFQAFVGDFRKQFKLYYSPNGEYEPYDVISSPYYKLVTIQQVDKTEKDQYGWYECSVSFTTQADVWKRDLTYFINNEGNPNIGEALVYPYTYKYVMGGRDIYTIDLPNDGREVGCIIKIKNNSETPLSELEWFVEHTYIDYYGLEQQDPVQRAKWYTTNTDIILQEGYELYVDSNPTTQEAKVSYTDGTSQSVVAWQEPSWDYINFVRLKHGQNRIVFYVAHPEVDITVTYQEQKELI